MGSLQVFIFVFAMLLKLHRIAGVPVLNSGQVVQSMECRIETMKEVEHKTFYNYCSSFEGSQVNIPRTRVYFSKGEKYTLIEDVLNDYFKVVNKTSVSPECLILFQPFLCFYYFKFPITDNCEDGYLPPCTDLCERTHDACTKDFESMVEKGVANHEDIKHLDCVNFEETTRCITFTPSIPKETEPEDDLRTDIPGTDPVATASPAENETSEMNTTETQVPIECNCAKKVRQTVTKRLIMDPQYTLGKFA